VNFVCGTGYIDGTATLRVVSPEGYGLLDANSPYATFSGHGEFDGSVAVIIGKGQEFDPGEGGANETYDVGAKAIVQITPTVGTCATGVSQFQASGVAVIEEAPNAP